MLSLSCGECCVTGLQAVALRRVGQKLWLKAGGIHASVAAGEGAGSLGEVRCSARAVTKSCSTPNRELRHTDGQQENQEENRPLRACDQI